MPFDYMGQSGDYHMFRDSATGEEYPVGQEDADYLMSQQASAPEPAAPPMPLPPPATPPGLDPRGRSVQAVPASAMSGPQQPLDPRGRAAQQVPSMGPGLAPDEPPEQPRTPNLQRVMPRDNGAPQPRMRAPGVIDNGDGTISQYRAGSEGGWQHVSRRGGGTDPALLGDLANKAGELRDQRIQNMYDAEAAQSENLMAEREAAAARRMQAQLERERSEAVIKKVETERDTKWKEFSTRQEAIGKMSGAPASENWGTVILSALAAGLGAYGSAMTGTPNFALDILNNAKKQKIDQARYDVDKAKSDLGSDREEFDRYLSTSLDGKRLERQAAIEREQIEAMREIEADKELRGVHPQMAEVRAQAEQQYQQTLAALYSQWQVESTDRYAAPTAGGWTRGVDPELELQARVREKQRAASGGTSETEIRTPDGEVIGAAPDKDARKDLNTRVAAFADAERLGAQMLELVEKQGKESSLGFRNEEDKALYKSLAVRYKNALWSATRSDAPSESESEQFAEAMGGLELANFRTGRQRSVLQQTLEDGRGNLADRLQQGGADPSYLRNKKRNFKDEGYVP